VLVFGVPASPLAQPWPVLAGNTLSALLAVGWVRLLGGGELTAALAVGSALALMFALRCLHPPGGAAALLVALLGVGDPRFALLPVGVNSLLLVLVGIAYNNATRRSYPHLPPAPVAPRGVVDAAAALDALDAELDAVLTRHDHILDIDREDLRALLEDAHLQSYSRRFADLRCAAIMSRDPVTLRDDATLAQARPLFGAHHALPVLDAAGRLVGIVTPADCMRAQAAHAAPDTTRVASIMSRQLRVADAELHLSELVPLFAAHGHHHIPVVDRAGALVGMLTGSDVVAALCKVEDRSTETLAS
jgi:CBS domain-containing membrane protein